MKVYISQPRENLQNEQVIRTYKKYKDMLEKIDNVVVIESVIHLQEQGITPLHYLAESIALISQCDGVLFAPGWEKYRECILHYQIADLYNKWTKIIGGAPKVK